MDEKKRRKDKNIKGFKVAVCAALCAALAGRVSACGIGAVTGGGGSQGGSTPGEDGEPNVPDIETEPDDEEDISLSDVVSHTMVSGESYQITRAGAYVIGGRAKDASIVVKADAQTVRLVLDNVSLTCGSGPVVRAEGVRKLIITLTGGENTLTGGGPGGAAVYSGGSLTVNGFGKLSVNGSAGTGMAAEGTLRITGGDIAVVSEGDGLTAKEGLLMKDGNLMINAGGGGIALGGDGIVNFTGGSSEITAGGSAVTAAKLSVKEGSLSVTAGGGSAQAGNGEGRGLSAAAALKIEGGRITADSASDAIFCGGGMAITGGAVTVAAGQRGVSAGQSLKFDGAALTVLVSVEAVSAGEIEINGGEISINAGGDGIVARSRSAGGEESAPGGKLTIGGGYIAVRTGGSGLDASLIEMGGGTALIYSYGLDAAIDYAERFNFDGGTLVAVSLSGARAPSHFNRGGALNIGLGSQPAGTAVNVSGGGLDLTVMPPVAFSSLVIAGDAVAEGELYTVSYGGSAVETGDGLGSDYSGGNILAQFTAQAGVTHVGIFSDTVRQNSCKSRPEEENNVPLSLQASDAAAL